MTDEPGRLFIPGEHWSDMDAWHARAAEIRRDDPVPLVAIDGFAPFWVLTRHADVQAVSRDNDHWLNTTRSVLGLDAEWTEMLASGVPEPKTLVHLDGQEHRSHRMVTNDWFKPAAVKRRQPRIDEIADIFVQRMRDLGGECDFAEDIAKPYTLRVIMDIYGVPESDERLMMELTQGLFGAGDPEFAGEGDDPNAVLIASVMRFINYFNGITADRRAHPGDDLASVIANGEIDGELLGDAERLWYYIIVATAGHDTTSYALSGGMEALLRTPDELKRVRGDEELALNAADEMIRWTSPVRHFMRYATDPAEIGGVPIPAGGRVLLSYPSANRDEAAFVDPMQFDIGRPDADKMIAFGAGTHFCLGSQFARREIRTMMAKLAAELDEIEPAGPAQWTQTHFVSGVKHLPVRYRFR